MSESHSDALVFFGATGDLAYKKIFPALQALVRRGHLNVPVIGVATIDAMKAAGATALSIDAGKTLMLDGDAIIKVANIEAPTTLDEADAAVLAMSAAASASTDSLIELHCAAEGRFAVAFKGEGNGHRT